MALSQRRNWICSVLTVNQAPLGLLLMPLMLLEICRGPPPTAAVGKGSRSAARSLHEGHRGIGIPTRPWRQGDKSESESRRGPTRPPDPRPHDRRLIAPRTRRWGPGRILLGGTSRSPR